MSIAMLGRRFWARTGLGTRARFARAQAAKQGAVRAHDEAVKQLAITADYITKCGYHRRDEELAELEAVLAGQILFADLPPRV